jgi:DNA-binding MarR family transcriptional regulator
MAYQPLTRIMMILEEFRKIDPELPMQIALIFVLIARKPGISQKELIQLTGLGRSSVSRTVALLSKELGKGFVTMREDPADRRSKVVTLTPEGERLSRSLEHYVADGENV